MDEKGSAKKIAIQPLSLGSDIMSKSFDACFLFIISKDSLFLCEEIKENTEVRMGLRIDRVVAVSRVFFHTT